MQSAGSLGEATSALHEARAKVSTLEKEAQALTSQLETLRSTSMKADTELRTVRSTCSGVHVTMFWCACGHVLLCMWPCMSACTSSMLPFCSPTIVRDRGNRCANLECMHLTHAVVAMVPQVNETAAARANELKESAHKLAAANASYSHLDLNRAPYVLYGVKYIDLVSPAPFAGQG